MLSVRGWLVPDFSLLGTYCEDRVVTSCRESVQAAREIDGKDESW